ncbi:pyrroloquinoline quinone biosynthesis protein PqqB [Polaribacter sp. WD7]|uniref:MBL fold metallo-hydrolase n=1 Tax=Polaribacter sp. WD7 TaxID=2269061 RepID=UPI000DF219F2|nr:MBL fold metallo-hydrolase [Polaribacter sp. WD7]RCS26423.1 pyrroloquinoline quinone biosynthesis protein PqqB [Polaribacter sp. WD7]
MKCSTQLYLIYSIVLLFLIQSCSSKQSKVSTEQYITILGIVQDGGYPHIGCQKICCTNVYNGKSKRKNVIALGLVDLKNQQKWLFEATPDMHTQLAILEQNHLQKESLIDGVFLTHAHIGHYTGLMYFGREALGKKNIPVYTMPKMKNYLENNGPWNQLISLQNIVLKELQHNIPIVLNPTIKVTPFVVPHRDEFSETVGYKIEGSKKTALFIPDIDKWEKWKKNIIDEVKKVDYAFLDATFFNQKEVKRAMTEVPHPFIEETITLFQNESLTTKNKVIFIHFNHTNPALQEDSNERKAIEKLGFRFASEGNNYQL